MPQLDKVMFIYVFFWFFIISIIFYSLFYIFYLLPFVNRQKIIILNYLYKLNNLGL